MITLILGDCLKELKKISNKSVNSIVCDFPYYQVVKNDWDNQWDCKEEYLGWCSNIIKEYKRILKDKGNIFLFTGREYNRYISIILDMFFIEKRIIIWKRKRNFNNTRGKCLASGYEPICYYSNDKNSIFNNIKIKSNCNRKEYVEGILKDGITLDDVWDIPSLPHNSKEKVDHPAQKPLKLLERILLMGSNEGDIILDNCMGSGSTGIACYNLNRNFIGIEINEKYFNIAKKRFFDLGIEID
jgi:site-specific DNA-methyltransferase (adenine-specific)